MMDTDQLKAALDEARERFHLPSYSVTLYEDGIFTNLSGGYRDLEQKLPAGGDTLYAIGSCTKSFVAGTVCTLIDRGLLGLDDCVKDHIPEFEMADHYVSDHLTVRDMLCHRCGLPRHELSWYSRLNTIQEKDVIRMLRYLRPNQPFRYKWQYSNQMYALAGYLIERVSGENWRDVLRRNIFDPLGVARAAFSPREAQALGGCAVPYLYDRETCETRATPYADIGAMGAAGCLYLTTEELAKWDSMLLGGGVYGGKRVISEKMCREMLTPQMIQQDGILEPMKVAVSNSGYGLGLMTEVFRGRRLVHHGGHINGFMADQSLLPDDGFACAILTNMGQIRGAQVMRYISAEHRLGGDTDWSRVLYDFYEGEEAKLKEKTGTLMKEKPENAPCPVAPGDICGTYADPGYGDIEITAEGDRLRVRIGELVLTGIHYANQYFYLEAPSLMPGEMIEACVDIDAKGKILSFSANLEPESDQKIRFLRKNNT